MNYYKFIDKDGNTLSVGSTSDDSDYKIELHIPDSVEKKIITKEEYQSVIDGIV